ncbi:MAG TPA: GntG family PLP-dependent aldolase [Balneolaceae bacterium]|nr:GntG family PLP-dependent aldolase [Balneolaceae bacterium]
MIDLRSDTVTKPTPEMRNAIAAARVGDDVFQADPTVNALQKKMAGLFGFEAGLFVPSGVMANQISLKLLTDPGDEVIIDEFGHIFNYETTSAAIISSIQLRPVQGSRGKLNAGLIRKAVRSGQDMEPHSKMIALENSTNKGGGACYSASQLKSIRSVANELDLAVHLDGARIWNAMHATDIEAEFFGNIADTMSICFSKGLGAPVGSMILSTKENIRRARRLRKMLGGGMRQIGLLAAAADYAVQHHWPLLKEDHRRAKALAETIDSCTDLTVDMDAVKTNILIFETKKESAKTVVDKLAQRDILLVPFGPHTVRATFHFLISDEDLAIVQDAFKELFG